MLDAIDQLECKNKELQAVAGLEAMTKHEVGALAGRVARLEGGVMAVQLESAGDGQQMRELLSKAVTAKQQQEALLLLAASKSAEDRAKQLLNLSQKRNSELSQEVEAMRRERDTMRDQKDSVCVNLCSLEIRIIELERQAICEAAGIHVQHQQQLEQQRIQHQQQLEQQRMLSRMQLQMRTAQHQKQLEALQQQVEQANASVNSCKMQIETQQGHLELQVQQSAERQIRVEKMQHQQQQMQLEQQQLQQQQHQMHQYKPEMLAAEAAAESLAALQVYNRQQLGALEGEIDMAQQQLEQQHRNLLCVQVPNLLNALRTYLSH